MSDLTSHITHFHLFESDDLAIPDAQESAHRLEVLAKLAAEQLPLTPEQSEFVRALMPREYGTPQEHNAMAKVWSLRTEGAHGERGVLRIRVPHDASRVVDLSFIPPSRGTWIDESASFSQETLTLGPPERHHDPNGGKAIAAQLLARLKAV